MKIAGIDYSISSPSVCVYDTSMPFEYSNLEFLAMPASKKIDGVYDNIHIIQNLGPKAEPMKRYDWLSRHCAYFLKSRGVKRVYLEDYSFGSRGRVFHIGENCGILKHYLWHAEIEIETVAPTSLKKFATEKGNAKKEQMVEQFAGETGVDLWAQFQIKNTTKTIPSPIDDIVDSYYLAKYGYSITQES